ncbi:Ni/Fe hydrogenase subunit alpha [bacterium]|nr:Ni/Fe hydrogenase subunit alpha [bacterium]
MKRRTITDITRVEGHGGISVDIKDGKILDIKVNVYEGPRLVEQLVVGKSPRDVLNIVPRICGICSLSHRYAALLALEKALGVKVPKATEMARNLMLIGEILQSHVLHLYFLALPDFLGYGSSIDLIDNHEDLIMLSLGLKSFGYRMNQVLSGRMVHGENPVLGGFGLFPERSALLELKEKSQEFIAMVQSTIELFASFEFPVTYDKEITFMCLNPTDGEYAYLGDSVVVSDGTEWGIDDYKEYVKEYVVPYSSAKRAKYKGKPFTVGALARINLLGERLTGEAGRYYKSLYSNNWKANPLFTNLAQAIEVLHCLESVPKLVDRIIKLKEPGIVEAELDSGASVGAVEAPRGTLYHYYEIENGLVRSCDVVTPTAQNLDDIEKSLKIAGEQLISLDSMDKLESTLEMITRAYDPCISCSAHLIRINYTDKDS